MKTKKNLRFFLRGFLFEHIASAKSPFWFSPKRGDEAGEAFSKFQRGVTRLSGAAGKSAGWRVERNSWTGRLVWWVGLVDWFGGAGLKKIPL